MTQRSHYNSTMRGMRAGFTFTEAELEEIPPDAIYWEACANGAHARLKELLGQNAYEDFAGRVFMGHAEDFTHRQIADALESAVALAEYHDEKDTVILAEIARAAMRPIKYGEHLGPEHWKIEPGDYDAV